MIVLNSAFRYRHATSNCRISMPKLLRHLSNTETGMSESTQVLANGILNGRRDCLAKAITLIESTRLDHKQQSNLLLDYLTIKASELKQKGLWYGDIDLQHEYAFKKGATLRLGIAGPPGAGVCYSPSESTPH